MSTSGKHSNFEEIAALLAAGALPSNDANDAEHHPQASEFLRVAAMLAEAIPAVEPPARAKEAILSRVAETTDPRHSDRRAAEELPEISFKFMEDTAFVPTRHPLLWARVLHIDPIRKQFSAVIRLEPGGSFPGHTHDGPEECLVIEGELLVGDVRMKAGDFQRVESGSLHVEQRSPSGALLFLIAPLSLLGD